MLRRAVDALDAVVQGIAGRGLPSDAVRLAEAVSTARSALYAELIRQGWVAPQDVPAGLELDAHLLGEGIGGGYDKPEPPAS